MDLLEAQVYWHLSRGCVRKEECYRLYSRGERLRDREIKHNVSEYGIAGSVLFIERQSVFVRVYGFPLCD